MVLLLVGKNVKAAVAARAVQLDWSQRPRNASSARARAKGPEALRLAEILNGRAHVHQRAHRKAETPAEEVQPLPHTEAEKRLIPERSSPPNYQGKPVRTLTRRR